MRTKGRLNLSQLVFAVFRFSNRLGGREDYKHWLQENLERQLFWLSPSKFTTP